MKPVPQETAPALELAEAKRTGRQLVVALDCAEEDARRARLELGRWLIKQREQWPARGPKAKGWGDFLESIGLDQQRAWELMKYAGYVEKVSPVPGEIPSMYEAGISRAPSVPSEPEPSAVEQLISEGVAPREAALQIVHDGGDWMAELERLALSMQRHARALFDDAEGIDIICRQHEASVTSLTISNMRGSLVAAKTSIQNALALMGGKK